LMWPVGWMSRRVTTISPFCYNEVTGLVCVWNIKYSLRWLGVSNHFLTFILFFFSFIFLSLYSFEIYPFLLYFYFPFTHFSAVYLFFSASLCFFF
jgi:hypothetical protein